MQNWPGQFFFQNEKKIQKCAYGILRNERRENCYLEAKKMPPMIFFHAENICAYVELMKKHQSQNVKTIAYVFYIQRYEMLIIFRWDNFSKILLHGKECLMTRCKKFKASNRQNESRFFSIFTPSWKKCEEVHCKLKKTPYEKNMISSQNKGFLMSIRSPEHQSD